MKTVNPEALKKLREYFTPGTRVELIKMNDPYTKIEPGEKGTVTCVDDIGTIHVRWDCGSSLGVVLGEDDCRKADEQEKK